MRSEKMSGHMRKKVRRPSQYESIEDIAGLEFVLGGIKTWNLGKRRFQQADVLERAGLPLQSWL